MAAAEIILELELQKDNYVQVAVSLGAELLNKFAPQKSIFANRFREPSFKIHKHEHRNTHIHTTTTTTTTTAAAAAAATTTTTAAAAVVF